MRKASKSKSLTFGELRWIDGDSCEAVAAVPADLACCEGHFDGDPIVPGVFQLLGALLPTVAQAWPELGSLARVQKLKFVSPIRPGETIRVTATKKGPARVDFALWKNDQSCTQGVVFFSPDQGGS